MEEPTSNALQTQYRPIVFVGDQSAGIIGLKVWTGLTSTVWAFVDDFQREVQWDTLDAATKEKLNAWAPKAEAYLASQRTSSSTQCTCFSASLIPVPGSCRFCKTC